MSRDLLGLRRQGAKPMNEAISERQERLAKAALWLGVVGVGIPLALIIVG